MSHSEFMAVRPPRADLSSGVFSLDRGRVAQTPGACSSKLDARATFGKGEHMDYEELMRMIEGVEFDNRDSFIDGMNNLNAGAQARITELETANATLAADLQKSQADNYKLIMAQTAKDENAGGEEEEKEEVTEEEKDVTKLIKD